MKLFRFIQYPSPTSRHSAYCGVARARGSAEGMACRMEGGTLARLRQSRAEATGLSR